MKFERIRGILKENEVKEMAYIQGANRSQMCLPEFIEDLVSEDNPVRVIDSFVDSLNMQNLGFVKAQPAQTGRPAYDPRDLLKLYIYGYFNKLRSSRKLKQECTRNIELFFLLNRLTPDFRTIADFRKENAEPIKKVFLEFTRLCSKLNLYGNEYAIDGSKFRAVNGRKKMFNQEILNKKLLRIEERLNQYLKELDAADQIESEYTEEDIKQIRKATALRVKTKELKDRRAVYEGYRKELQETGETQKLLTDPEARMMHTKDGFHCCYNIQTAVDSKSHLIAEYKVTNKMNDQQILFEFAGEVKKALSKPVLDIVADKGYDSRNEIEKCVMSGTVPYVGFREDKKERIYVIDYIPCNISSKRKESCKPEDISACLHAGVLPLCYENTNISIEVTGENSIGCFSRSEDKGSVVCPMGFTLRKKKNKRNGIEYASNAACRQCTNRCTPSKKPKVVYFGPETSHVAAVMYGKETPANILPPGFVPNNSFFRKHRTEKTVLIKIRDDALKQKQRLCISEHPFGTIKWHHGAHYLLCKGIQKATAELGLSFLAYNLKRAINLIGTQKILLELGV